MNLEFGDIIVAKNGEKFLLVNNHDLDDEYPYLLINLETSEVYNAYRTPDAIERFHFRDIQVIKGHKITIL